MFSYIPYINIYFIISIQVIINFLGSGFLSMQRLFHEGLVKGREGRVLVLELVVGGVLVEVGCLGTVGVCIVLLAVLLLIV